MIDRRALALVALVIADICLLLFLRLAGTTGPLELAGQLVLAVAFLALALIDLRAAVALAVLELALAGASGRWTVYPANVSGRIVLDAVVFAVAIGRLVQARLAGQRLDLGRYTVHFVLAGILLAGIWIPLGLLNGWRPVDAWADGNGYLFFAFAVVLAALALRSDLGWLRRWLLFACCATAVLTAGLALLGLALMTFDDPLRIHRLGDVLLGVLEMGGSVSIRDGNMRLGLGSGLYLLVGVALLTWEIAERPRQKWPWLMIPFFVIALLASYTRAYWLGAVLAVVMVAVIGLPDRRRLLAAGAAAGVLAISITFAGWLGGVWLPDIVVSRIATTFILPDDSVDAYIYETGVVSNAIKIHQARVLLGHIAERPLTGWGFGAIAPDYRYGQIYSYELSYIALAYKAGIFGLLLFLSVPLRLLYDAVRMRLGRLELPSGVSRRQAAVPITVVSTLVLLGATNPFLVASFGLAPIVLMICWLDPFGYRGRAPQTDGI